MRINSKIIIVLLVVLSFAVFSGIDPVIADDSSDDGLSWRGGPHIGFSHYTGLIGIELQKGHWGYTIGIPAAVGVRYYLDNLGYRWFFGANTMYYIIEDADETKDGIHYDEFTSTSAGLGGGYKWRFKNHWDITLSLSMTWDRDEFKNDYVTRTEDYIMVMPGLTLGYTF